MTSTNDLTKLVPGFDFLQGLMKTGSAGMPSFGQWIAPTLEPEELQRRIDELRTVQYWLEQNAKLIGTTIQALEVQRMTLATLKGMNVPFADLTEALMIGKPKSAAVSSPASAASAAPGSAPARKATEPSNAKIGAAEAPAAAATPGARKAGAAAPVDPMQWWGALTQQFTELATKALEDGSAEMARNLASAAVKQGFDNAGDRIEHAMSISGKAAGLAAGKAASLATRAGAVAAGKTLGRVAKAARRRKA